MKNTALPKKVCFLQFFNFFSTVFDNLVKINCEIFSQIVTYGLSYD